MTVLKNAPDKEGATEKGAQTMAAFHQATDEMNDAYLKVRNMAVQYATYGHGSIEALYTAIMQLPQQFIDALSVAIPFDTMRETEKRIARR